MSTNSAFPSHPTSLPSTVIWGCPSTSSYQPSYDHHQGPPSPSSPPAPIRFSAQTKTSGAARATPTPSRTVRYSSSPYPSAPPRRRNRATQFQQDVVNGGIDQVEAMRGIDSTLKDLVAAVNSQTAALTTLGTEVSNSNATLEKLYQFLTKQS